MVGKLVATLLAFASCTEAARGNNHDEHGRKLGRKGKQKLPKNKDIVSCEEKFGGDQMAATAFSTAFLAQFWADLATTGCNETPAAGVYKEHFTKDIQVFVCSNLVFDGLDALFEGVKESLLGQCASNITYWTPTEAVTFNVNDDKAFDWVGFENIGAGESVTQTGREYTFTCGKKVQISKIIVTDDC